MSEHPDFDKIIAAEFGADADTETPSLAHAVDALMATNAELTARLAYYEQQAQNARHAFRDLKKVNSAQAYQKAHDGVRNALRSIHPTTSIK